MNDAERFIILQKEVLAATMKAIQENIVGLPVQAVSGYIRQMGGDIMIAGEGTILSDIKDKKPFRIVVTISERADIMKATKVFIVDKVVGWS